MVPQCAALMDELQIGSVNDEFTTDLRSRKLTTTGARDERGRAIIWVRLRFHQVCAVPAARQALGARARCQACARGVQPKESSPARVAKLLATIALRELEDAETARCGVCVLQERALSNLARRAT